LLEDLPVGKLTDLICGPASAGGAFDVVPAPPDAHGVECGVDCRDDAAPRPGKAVDADSAAREPGTTR
jgi:hypothetical protein